MVAVELVVEVAIEEMLTGEFSTVMLSLEVA
jgi:hypothetical protein